MKTQLDSLTAFFTQNVPERARRGFDSQIDGMQVISAARDLGAGQYRLSVLRYTALLSWERFPFRLVDPQLLVALLEVWMDEHAAPVMEELGIENTEADWDVTLEDEETATVVLTLPLADELVIRPDAAGLIPYRGERWSLVEPEIWTALSATVHGVDEAGAPVGES